MVDRKRMLLFGGMLVRYWPRRNTEYRLREGNRAKGKAGRWLDG